MRNGTLSKGTEGASRTRWDSMSAKDLPTLRQVEQEEEEAERAA
jgi:hypothetical protein